ncbi:LLM class flavin-dependent oxidoreductase [Amycolatopsis magusensis]|uniref:LLM class flavin-dependent oxidoreductase n=1 Tax=Amycolatopsis magusensis TaxID=882444 RepID=UPI0037BE0019
MTGLRIGVQYTPAPDAPVGDVVRAAAEIEAMGFCCFCLPDHVSRPLQGHDVPVAEPIAMLARIAADTRTIGLGTMTLLDALRPAVQTVRCAATLQYITAGRYELGIGAGWQQRDFATLPPGAFTAENRVNAVDTTARLLRDTWPAADGGFVRGRRGAPAFATDVPAPALIIAAGSRRMLELAARWADTLALTVPTRQRLAGVTPTAASVADQIATARAARPGGLAPLGVHLQIRSLTPKRAPASGDDWWSIGGSPARIAHALHDRAAAGVTYLSVCTEDLRLLEFFASRVLPLCEG